MNNDTLKLTKHLQEVFDGDPWYGDNIIKKLSAITSDEANYHPATGAHSIAQLLKHMTNWKRMVAEKLRNNTAENIEMNSKEDWDTDLVVRDENEWQDLINEYTAVQQELIALLNAKTEEDMQQTVNGSSYNMAYMAHGIYEHDIYHLGQIGYVQGMYQRNRSHI